MQKNAQMPKNMNKASTNEGFNKPSRNDSLSESFFQRLFELSPNPYLVLKVNSPTFTIEAVNNSYLTATRTVRSDIVGRSLFEVFPDNPSDPSATGVSDLHISLDRVIQNKTEDVMGIQKYDIPRRDCEDGFEVKYWTPVNTPVFDETGTVTHILHRVEDVTEFVLMREHSFQEAEKIQAKTERIEAEVLRNSQELKVSNRNLKVANQKLKIRERELEQLNERLQKSDQVKTAFFSNISHEFRTPLTLILGPIEDALYDSAAFPENRERMEIAYRNVLRLLKLVNNLLDFMRIEAGRGQVTYQATDLSRLTAELASMFRSATTKAELTLTIDCPPLPEAIYVDQDMWEKIVLNLISNAFKHTFEGEITVRQSWKHDHVELIVQDTGVGIPNEQLSSIFERFHRVPNARSRTFEGSGIGLALVYELVKLHQGSIDVGSKMNQGTIFRICIPSGKNHLPADQIVVTEDGALSSLKIQPFVEEALWWLPHEARDPAKPIIIDKTAWTKPNGDIVRVLLVDDNADMRNYISRLLEPYCQFKAVSDGKLALQSARQNPPDLILSDIMMPNMDGFTFLSTLRRDTILRTVPVILISARAGEEARIEGLQAGADDYLVKPFNGRELQARVKANLNLELQQARLAAEEAKKESEEKFRLIFNQAAAGIAQTDLSGRFLLVNQRYCDIVGRTFKDLMQLHIQDITHPDDLEVNQSLFEQAVQTGEACKVENRYICPNGSSVWVLNHVSLIMGPTGHSEGMLAVCQDITELKKAQDELKAYAIKLERSNKDLEHFAVIASHDLQEPLRKVMMFSDHLRSVSKALLNEEALDDIERMQRATTRMQALIDDLLELSRVTRRGKPFQRVNLSDVITDILADLHLQNKEAQERIQVGNMMAIDADPGQMRQLLENLISNAMKFHSDSLLSLIQVSAEPFNTIIARLLLRITGLVSKKSIKVKFLRFLADCTVKVLILATGLGFQLFKRL